MSSIVDTSMDKVICGRRVLELNVKLLYWQGMWDEDPEPDLEFYLKFFSPRLAQLLVQHRSLRLGLRFFRTFYSCCALGLILYDSLVTLPVNVVYYWGVNKGDSIEAVYFLTIDGFLCVCFATAYLRKKEIQKIFQEMETVLLRENLNNEEQLKIYSKAQEFCYKLTYYSQCYLIPIVSLTVLLFSGFVLLPNRIKLYNEVYPLNSTSSPIYEIVLIVRNIQTIVGFFAANTQATLVFSTLIHLKACYSILKNKIETIRSYSMEIIQASKFAAIQQVLPVAGSSSVNEQHFSTNGGSGSYEYANMDIVQSSAKDMTSDSFLRDGHWRVGQIANETMWTEHGTLWKPREDINQRVIMVQSCNTPLTGQEESVIEIATDPGDDIHSGASLQQEHDSEAEYGEVDSEQLDKEMCFQLGRFVELHQLCLDATNKLCLMYNQVFATYWLVNVVFLALTMSLLANVEEKGIREIIQFIISIETMSIYFVFNYAANTLTDQAAALGEAIYACDWLRASKSFKKSLVIIMSRIERPLVIKPTGLEPLSLKNFAEVSNIAYKMLATIESVAK